VRHDETMSLYPHPAGRIANGGPGLCLVAFALTQVPNTEAFWLFLILCTVGTILMFRGYRMGLQCNDSAVVVFGLLHTRTIAKSAIISADTDMAGFPSVSWRTTANNRRWTPIIAFWASNSEFGFSSQIKMRRLEQFRGWLDRGPHNKH